MPPPLYALLIIWANLIMQPPALFPTMEACHEAAKVKKIDGFGWRTCVEYNPGIAVTEPGLSN